MKLSRMGMVVSISLLALAGCTRHEMEGIVDITFEVEAPGLPDRAVVFVSGNRPELGDWEPYEMPLNHQDGDLWSVTVPFPYGARMEYKFTLGSWTTEAVDEHGANLPNFTLAATRSHTVHHKITHWKSDQPAAPHVTGDVRFHRGLAGEGLLPRDAIVWLPPGYDTGNDRYPVIYMHDGQNVFDPTTSFLGTDWGVDETATRLIGEGRMQPVIIVGLYNTAQRSDDYGFGDQGRAYQRFIVDVVKPLIDATYRTKPERGNTATMGSSLGGLISFLMVWNHPDVFGQAACLSPAFFPEVTDDVRAAGKLPESIRIYMDNGTLGLDAELQAGCDTMKNLLSSMGLSEGRDFQWVLAEGAEHNEMAWAARVEKPLRFLFGSIPRQP